MYETSIAQGCASIMWSLAVIGIIMTALGTMVGLVKPTDALKYCAAIVGIVIVLVLIVSVFVDLSASMSLWQKVVVAVIVFSVWRLRLEWRKPRKKREEE